MSGWLSGPFVATDVVGGICEAAKADPMLKGYILKSLGIQRDSQS
jgi:hypothetical protein